MALSKIELGSLLTVVGVAFAAGGWAYKVEKSVSDLQDSGITLPSGAVVFFALEACPEPGWTSIPNAGGRYVVALPEGGVAEATVGEPLENEEARAVGRHNHVMEEAGRHAHSTDDAGNHRHDYGDQVSRGVGSNAGLGDAAHRKPVGKETKPAGKHSHNISENGAHTHSIEERGQYETNAPYIQYVACERT